MESKKRILIVDDNEAIAKTAKMLLDAAGHETSIQLHSPDAIAQLLREKPDCLIVDIMMPELDGLELVQMIREIDELKYLKIVVFSAKAFEFDRNRAFAVGANGFIRKPVKPDTFAKEVMSYIDDQIEIAFWGVRGTLPRSGANTLRYGGNTSCVSLTFAHDPLIVLDAGSGIKNLGDFLLRSGRKRITGKIFISHPHWDHINALPFFTPLFIPGNEFEIIGPSHGSVTIEQQVSAQMEGVYFPITVREFGAYLTYKDMREGTYDIGDIKVRTLLLSHPGYCLGYRFDYKGRSVCYVTDNEMFDPHMEFYSEDYFERITDFVKEADYLITDTTYFDKEYAPKVGWGHSTVGQVVNFAHAARVKNLCLFHHDPDQNDDMIDAKLADAQQRLAEKGSSTVCMAPGENTRIRL